MRAVPAAGTCLVGRRSLWHTMSAGVFLLVVLLPGRARVHIGPHVRARGDNEDAPASPGAC